LIGTPNNKKKLEGGYLFDEIVFGECGLNFSDDEKYYEKIFNE